VPRSKNADPTTHMLGQAVATAVVDTTVSNSPLHTKEFQNLSENLSNIDNNDEVMPTDEETVVFVDVPTDVEMHLNINLDEQVSCRTSSIAAQHF
jgi:hypothetical protein